MAGITNLAVIIARPYRPRWWHAVVIALWWVVAPALFGCAPTQAPAPPLPIRYPAVVNHDPRIGRLIIPREFNQGVWLCFEDRNGLHAPDCVSLQHARQWAAGFRPGD